MKKLLMGFDQALGLTLKNLKPLTAEKVALMECAGRVAAADLHAQVDSPSLDTSRKDGYAIMGLDAAGATTESPARLRLLGSMAAGGSEHIPVQPGCAVRVLTGARIPGGADTVVAEEYTRQDGDTVLIQTLDDSAKNVLPQGGDVERGQLVLQCGQVIRPTTMGLLATAGLHMIPVHKKPIVGILGTGDEIIEPGRPLHEGQVYASNIVTLAGLCRQRGMRTRTAIAPDDRDALLRAVQDMCAASDALLTSGGAWRGDRDLMADVLEELGWRKVFHQVRMGPGKAVGFGLLHDKPVFILPGGPPSNLMAFLQIALPGLQVLCGHGNPGLPCLKAELAAELCGGKPEWTDFFFARLEAGQGLVLLHPMAKRSRLHDIARATAVVAIPEGQDHLEAGSIVSAQLIAGAG